jgi:1-deoxy-D-xylulose-5-phosphate synthase
MSHILDCLQTPGDLRRWPLAQLEALAQAIRERIVQTVSVNGGHLGGSLGVVELAIALHYVFDFPRDRLIWDVGHQVYPHKLLTGRAGRFHTLRTEGGVSGYPAPEESPYDLFATAHAGTAASLAVGLAMGDGLRGRPTRTVAVVGDGALSAGVAFEALNNAAVRRLPLLLILNDNRMSIDKTIGGLAEFLDQARSPARARPAPAPGPVPASGRAISAAGFFEALGLSYVGPHDGHDLARLIEVLQSLCDHERPVLLHLHTHKGRGFLVQNPDPCGFHALTPFRVQNGQVTKKATPTARPSFTEVFAQAIVQAAEQDSRLMAITAAMPDGTGLLTFRQRFPERYVDVGICEQHAVAFAAGAAKAGARPVAAIYSTFLQRAFDQIFHEVALQNLPVIFALDRAGLVGADGPTHHGHADIAYLRLWPNFIVCAPADAAELHACLRFALQQDQPVAFRYPRDEAVPAVTRETCPFELGKAVTLRTGPDAMLAAYGVMVPEALQAAEILAERGIQVGVLNARFAKPLDEEALAEAMDEHPLLVTVEDHFGTGGFGSAVLEFAAQLPGPRARIVCLGIPDRFLPHATRRRQLEWAGLTGDQIAARVAAELEQLAALREPCPASRLTPTAL